MLVRNTLRKFRLADSQQLSVVYQDALQIQAIIENATKEGEPAEGLPDSLVPTGMLYDLASAYLGMYELVLNNELAIYNTATLLKTAKIN